MRSWPAMRRKPSERCAPSLPPLPRTRWLVSSYLDLCRRNENLTSARTDIIHRPGGRLIPFRLGATRRYAQRRLPDLHLVRVYEYTWLSLQSAGSTGRELLLGAGCMGFGLVAACAGITHEGAPSGPRDASREVALRLIEARPRPIELRI